MFIGIGLIALTVGLVGLRINKRRLELKRKASAGPGEEPDGEHEHELLGAAAKEHEATRSPLAAHRVVDAETPETGGHQEDEPKDSRGK